MGKKTNVLNRLSPTQLIFILILLVVAGVYEFLIKGASPAPAFPPTDTPQISGHKPSITFTSAPSFPTTDTPVGPAGQPATEIAPARITPPGPMSKFDYFVLALSWSPDYCASNGSNDPQQCSIGKKLGFVLHGLWPQYKQGYPSNCTNEKLSEDVKAYFPGLYPNVALYDHEWEKHGTCTGLSTQAYLNLTSQIKASVIIPEAYHAPAAPFRTTANELKQAFTATNPGFDETDLAVNCSSSGRYLKELYVCFARDGKPASCGADVQKSALKSCQNSNFLVRNTR